MKRAVRQEAILRRLQQSGSALIRDLSDALGVSQETIRREVRALENDGAVVKQHGAVVLAPIEEGPFAGRMKDDETIKQAIGAAAAMLIGDGSTLFIDGGTTSFFVARELAHREGLTVLTNSLPIAHEFVQARRAAVHLCGGLIDTGYQALYDRTAQNGVESFTTDLAILSVAAIDLAHGLMDVHPGEAAIGRLAIRNARHTMVVTASAKFGRQAFAKFGRIADVDILVTDRDIPPAYETAFAAARVIKA